MALFRVDFSGRGELADRQQKLAQMLSRLQKISEGIHVSLLITEQLRLVEHFVQSIPRHQINASVTLIITVIIILVFNTLFLVL